MVSVNIKNIVFSLNIYQEIPLNELTKKFVNVEYDNLTFPGAVARFINPRASAIIFQKGKIIITGIRNFEEYEKIKKRIFRMLKSVKINIEKYEEEIVNVVASLNLGFKIDIEKLAFDMENCEFEPDLFPGLIYKKEEPRIIFIIFKGGKISCMGGSIKIVEEEAKKFAKILEKYKITI
ncbi:MAG: TATA-box-binding protein [Thermoplasmata archaeon]